MPDLVEHTQSDIDLSDFNKNVQVKAVVNNFILRLVGIIIGGISIFLGYLLFIKGVTGQASIFLNTNSVSGQLLNAAPGLFFALSGVIIILFALYTKEKVSISKNIKKYPDGSIITSRRDSSSAS